MDWLSGWKYRRAVTITEQSGSDLTDFQVEIDLDSSNFDFSHAKADGSDIRITQDDGTTLLDYYIESWDSTGQTAKIWVKVPSLPANGTVTLYLYYGNSGATSESDGEAVFDFFDDFDGSSLDTNKWKLTTAGTASVSVSNSVAEIYTATGNSNEVWLASVGTFAFPHVAEAKVMLKASYEVQYGFFTSQTDEKSQHVRLDMTYYSGYNTDINSYDGSTTVSQNLQTITGNVWHKIGIKTDGNTHYAWWDDYSGSVTQTNNFSAYLMLFQVSAYDRSMTTDVDWVRVRKYASVDPSTSVGSEEIGLGIFVWDGSEWVQIA